MKKLWSISVLTLFLCLNNSELLAQKGRTQDYKSHPGHMYDLSKVEVIKGEVLSVEKISQMMGKFYGIHLMLKSDSETISVHLGPAWYLENQEAQFQPKDKVVVTGSRIIFQQKPAIIAAEVTRGEETLVLRNKKGYPVWSGWRRKGDI